MRSYRLILFFELVLFTAWNTSFSQQNAHLLPAPLYRDPVTDGAADPALIWNRQEKKWWMLYTQRRANTEAPDVAYCYGNAIGIASGEDSGSTWVYRGTLNLEFEKGQNTFWAPDIVYDKGLYHLFVAYIRGVRIHWGGEAHLIHYTSKNLWDWKKVGVVKLPSSKAIDPSLFQMPDGTWRMWYKDENRHSSIMMAESRDLIHWTAHNEPVLGKSSQEGPKIFYYKGYYWMLTDEWKGMRVYRSVNADHWEKQGMILDSASARPEDRPSGAHGDVIICGDQAWVIYFTHPGRSLHVVTHEDQNGIIPFSERRSSIQAAALVMKNGTLSCIRDSSMTMILESPLNVKTARTINKKKSTP